jgi:hypothetical protein
LKTCPVFILIAFASLTPGTRYAAPSNQDRPSQQPPSLTSENTLGDHPRGTWYAAPDDGEGTRKGGSVSDERGDHRHISDRNHPRSSLGTVTKERPKHLPNNRDRFPSRNGMNLRQPGSDKSGGTAKGGFIRRERVNSAVSPGPPNVIRPGVPSLNNVRHRGPNPAVVGGSPKSDGRNTGTIDGTRVHRKR